MIVYDIHFDRAVELYSIIALQSNSLTVWIVYYEGIFFFFFFFFVVFAHAGRKNDGSMIRVSMFDSSRLSILSIQLTVAT